MDTPSERREEPDIKKLRTARSSAKRNVTKQVNNVNLLLATEDFDNIEAEIDILKSVFKKFQCVHNFFYETIEHQFQNFDSILGSKLSCQNSNLTP